MNRLIGYLLVVGMAVTFIVAASHVDGFLEFLCYVWAVFLVLTLISQLVRKQ